MSIWFFQPQCGLFPAFEHDHLFAATFKQGIAILPVLPVEGQHIAVQGCLVAVKILRAVAAHILPCLSVVFQNPLGNAPKAGDGR